MVPRRWGLAVGTLLLMIPVTACGDEGAPGMIEAFSQTPEPAVITVFFTTGWCDIVDAPVAKESDDDVTVTVIVRAADPEKPCESIAPKEQSRRIALDKPLGQRAVRGSNQDAPVRERQPG